MELVLQTERKDALDMQSFSTSRTDRKIMCFELTMKGCLGPGRGMGPGMTLKGCPGPRHGMGWNLSTDGWSEGRRP